LVVVSESGRWGLAGSGCLAKSWFLEVILKAGFESIFRTSQWLLTEGGR
jgi:hypothetical protein